MQEELKQRGAAQTEKVKKYKIVSCVCNGNSSTSYIEAFHLLLSLSLSLSQEEADFRLALQMQEQFDGEMARAISESSTTALSSSQRYYSKQNNVTSQHGKQTHFYNKAVIYKTLHLSEFPFMAM